MKKRHRVIDPRKAGAAAGGDPGWYAGIVLEAPYPPPEKCCGKCQLPCYSVDDSGVCGPCRVKGYEKPEVPEGGVVAGTL